MISVTVKRIGAFPFPEKKEVKVALDDGTSVTSLLEYLGGTGELADVDPMTYSLLLSGKTVTAETILQDGDILYILRTFGGG